MATDRRQSSTSPSRLTRATERLLDWEERSMTLGNTWARRLAAAKAAEVTVALHNEAINRVQAASGVRRLTRAERQYGRIS